MRHAFPLIVLAAIGAAALTAPVLPQPQPQGVVVEEVRAANRLLAVKTGCYLVTTDSTPQASSAITALQQGEEAVRAGYTAAFLFLNRSGGAVQGVELRNGSAQVFLEHDGIQMGAGAAVALGLAAEVPIRIREELLKSAGENICTGEKDERTSSRKDRT